MNIEQHIEELRAELKWCDGEEEIAAISRELEAALAQKTCCESALGEQNSSTK